MVRKYSAQFNLKITEDQMKFIRFYADKEEMSMTDVVREMIEEFMAEESKDFDA